MTQSRHGRLPSCKITYTQHLNTTNTRNAAFLANAGQRVLKAGNPSAPMGKDYYAILGVSKTPPPTDEDLKKAYRKLAVKASRQVQQRCGSHTSACPPDQATRSGHILLLHCNSAYYLHKTADMTHRVASRSLNSPRHG